MAGPSTEIRNDDLKALREDFHKLSIELREDHHRGFLKISEEVHKVALEVRGLATKVEGIVATVRILGVFTLASLVSGVWWGASLTTKVGGLEARMDEKFKAVDARFDKLEDSIARVLEQTKPAPKP